MQIFDLHISSDAMGAGAGGAVRSGLAAAAPSLDQDAAPNASFANHLNATAAAEASSRSGLKAGTVLDGSTVPAFAPGGDPALEAGLPGLGGGSADGEAAADKLFAAAMAALGQLGETAPVLPGEETTLPAGQARTGLLDLVSADQIESDPIMFPDLSEAAAAAEEGQPADGELADKAVSADAVPAVAAAVVADQLTPAFFPALEGGAGPAAAAGSVSDAGQPNSVLDPLQSPLTAGGQGSASGLGSASSPVAPASAAAQQPRAAAGDNRPVVAPQPGAGTAPRAPLSAAATPTPASPVDAAPDPAPVKTDGVFAGLDAADNESAAPQQQAAANPVTPVATDRAAAGVSGAQSAASGTNARATGQATDQPTVPQASAGIVADDAAASGDGQAKAAAAGESLAERAPKSMTTEAAAPVNPADAQAARAAAPRVVNVAAQKDLEGAGGNADAVEVDGDGDADGDGVTRPQQAADTAAATARRPVAAPGQAAVAATAAAGMAALAASLDAAASDPLQGGETFDMTLATATRGGEAASHQPAAAGSSAAQTLPMALVAMEIARNAQRGVSRFEIRLDPPELGRVDVRLKIGDDGQVRAHLIVERPETLDMLLRDQRGMERALENAGLKTAANGGLEFSLKDQSGRSFADGGDQPSRGDAGATGDKAEETAVEKQGALERIAAYVRGGAGGLDIRV